LLTKPSNARSTALVFWGLNLLGVSGFSWVLFGRKRLDEATAVSLTMVVTSAAAAATASRVDKQAARAITPLIGWVIFASVLQEEVWRRND
jgi:translocator protein